MKRPVFGWAFSYGVNRVKTGEFCFLADEYFLDFHDDKLMKNKEDGHDRPCFFAIQDKLEPRIWWVVPISSKVEKYHAIADGKVKKYGTCHTIRFGTVLGKEKAFLIQNMCPATERYIKNIYVDRYDVPIHIDGRLEDDIIKNARKTLSDYFRGKKVIFPDVRRIKRELESQLNRP